MNMEQLLGWEMAGETELLGKNLPQYHYVHRYGTHCGIKITLVSTVCYKNSKQLKCIRRSFRIANCIEFYMFSAANKAIKEAVLGVLRLNSASRKDRNGTQYIDQSFP
jgi:hypothetical protein